MSNGDESEARASSPILGGRNRGCATDGVEATRCAPARIAGVSKGLVAVESAPDDRVQAVAADEQVEGFARPVLKAKFNAGVDVLEVDGASSGRNRRRAGIRQ